MKPLWITVLLLGSMVGLASAQKADTNDETRTRGLVNGRFWTILHYDTKLFFIIGFCEGAASADVCPPQSEFGEIVKGIDRLYQEPENLRLPFVDAARIFAMKVTGATATQIEAVMDRARKYADTPSPEK
jgi:hypothetical protein